MLMWINHGLAGFWAAVCYKDISVPFDQQLCARNAPRGWGFRTEQDPLSHQCLFSREERMAWDPGTQGQLGDNVLHVKNQINAVRMDF